VDARIGRPVNDYPVQPAGGWGVEARGGIIYFLAEA